MDPLATRLEDLTFPSRSERFGRVVERLSEPTNAPWGDNFVSNEDSYPRIAADLARHAPKAAVYVGVGPDQNFTLIAHAKPSLAFIADYRRRNLLVHLLHKALITLSTDRVAYLSRMTARVPRVLGPKRNGPELANAFSEAPLDRSRLERESAEVVSLTRPLDVVREEEWDDLARIQARIAGPGVNVRFLALPIYPTLGRMMGTSDANGGPAHFLALEATFQTVRTLQATDRVIPIVADLSGGVALVRLGDWLRDRGLQVGVFYVSDVEFFLLRAMRLEAYVANLGRLPWAEGALIVRSSTREIDHPARIEGDSSTTIMVDARAFLTEARAGRVRTPDDLFR